MSFYMVLGENWLFMYLAAQWEASCEEIHNCFQGKVWMKCNKNMVRALLNISDLHVLIKLALSILGTERARWPVEKSYVFM